ncbi:DUF5343 domain-containing protein [Microbacterium hydrothermale]|uniref:DUF5343 domain-containing protein n=1 Tax=Microbacterium hydrothermale TaxID=857427 RepID=UPI002226E6E5|nr:DUF5343 domain-containing protein [Microbacterium hydrothermale]
MADSASGTKSYPYISANVWNELRLRFQKSLPAKVTPSYLQTALGFNTEKAARNLLPQLKTVGLIDADGVPTDLAKAFRMDADYPDAAKTIVASMYPDELRDLFPGPTENSTEVTNWFMRETGGGQASAGTQARFYLALISGELPSAERAKSNTNGDAPPKPRAARAKAPSSKPSAPTAAPSTKPTDEVHANQDAPSRGRRGGPNLHIDVQVHISADASSDQIDAVFASMAKHLYGTE